MKRIPALFLSVVLFAVIPAPALFAAPAQQSATTVSSANAATWQPISLPDGIPMEKVKGLIVHPQQAATIYLATQHGLFQSGNAGDSWSRFDNLGDMYIFSVAQAESAPQQLYIHSFQSYRSEDGGASWQEMNPPEHTCGFTVAPSAPNRVYARRCGDVALPPVVRSDDGGRNWIVPGNGMTESFDTIAIHPTQPDTLIAGSFEETWRSTDGGDHWTQANVGTRFAGRPVFDRQSTPTMYMGHWTGLLRSQDAGTNWEDSTAAREFSTLVPLANEAGVLYGGNKDAMWRFAIDSSGWQATAWETPTGVETLYASAFSGDYLYARTTNALWRLNLQPPLRFTPVDTIYLPLIQNGGNATAAGADAVAVAAVSTAMQAETEQTAEAIAQGNSTQAVEEAVARANEYREKIGMSPLAAHPALVTAAQNHANYRLQNYADQSAWEFGAHGEVEGKPGFTGKWPSDRIKAAGFPWSGGAEVMHGLGDPTGSVDGWISTVYHRFSILDPYHDYIGYGYHSGAPVSVDVMDFGTGPTPNGRWISAVPHPLAYPADGQTDVPTQWDGGEVPSPLPPGVQGPVGYPFTLQAVGGKMTISQAELRTAAGAVVATHPNPADCAAGRCLALMAVNPLAPNTTYVVSATGDVEGVPFQREWRFTTGAASVVTSAAAPASAAMAESAITAK